MDSIITNITLTFSILQKLFAEMFFVLAASVSGFSSIYRFFSLQTPFFKWKHNIWFLCKNNFDKFTSVMESSCAEVTNLGTYIYSCFVWARTI